MLYIQIKILRLILKVTVELILYKELHQEPYNSYCIVDFTGMVLDPHLVH